MKKSEKLPASVTKEEDYTNFKGYTLKEIRVRREMAALKRDFCKVKIEQSISKLRPQRKEKSNSNNSKLGFVTKAVSALFPNSQVLNAVMLGLSLFGTAKKGYDKFKSKKKS